MAELMSYDVAQTIAKQECPLPVLAGQALRSFQARINTLEAAASAADARAFQAWVEENWNRRKTPVDGNPLRDLYIMGMGIGGESGEVQELLKKHVRDGREIRDDLVLELGDVLHYLTRIASQFDIKLTDVMEQNRVKLEARHAKRMANLARKAQPKPPVLAMDTSPEGDVLSVMDVRMSGGALEVQEVLHGDEARRRLAAQELGFDRPVADWPQLGDLVRYNDGKTALAVLDSPHAGGYHAKQCMGGITFISNHGWPNKFYRPTQEDLATWLECAKSRREATR